MNNCLRPSRYSASKTDMCILVWSVKFMFEILIYEICSTMYVNIEVKNKKRNRKAIKDHKLYKTDSTTMTYIT